MCKQPTNQRVETYVKIETRFIDSQIRGSGVGNMVDLMLAIALFYKSTTRAVTAC